MKKEKIKAERKSHNKSQITIRSHIAIKPEYVVIRLEHTTMKPEHMENNLYENIY